MRRSWNSLLVAIGLLGGLISLANFAGCLAAQEFPKPKDLESRESTFDAPQPKIAGAEESELDSPEPKIAESAIPSAAVSDAKVSDAGASGSAIEGAKVDGVASKSNSGTPDEAAKSARTLDDIRKLYQVGDKVPMKAGVEWKTRARMVNTRHAEMKFTPAKPTLPTTAQAKKSLDQLRARLRSQKGKPGTSDPEAEKVALDQALTNYFISDMKSRVAELDKIKVRVKELEGQLERRMKAKGEIIELQKKVLLSEVEGLGFFSGDRDHELGDDVKEKISEAEVEESSGDEDPEVQVRKF